MQRDDVRERPNSAGRVFPRRARQPREAIFGVNAVLVEPLGGELPGRLVRLHGVCDDGREVHVTAEVPGEVACTLWSISC